MATIRLAAKVERCSPSKVSGSSRFPDDVTAARLASREVRCPAEFYKQPARDPSGLSRRVSTPSFPTKNHGFYRLPSTVCLRSRFHPLVSFAPLQSPPGSACPARRSAEATFLGVADLPLRDVSRKQIARWIPRPSTLRPRRFSRPRRFASPPASWVYFTPLPRPGLSPSGVLSPAKPETPRRRPVPSRRWLGSAAAGLTRQRHVTSPRPQGFAPCGNPLLAYRGLAAT